VLFRSADRACGPRVIAVVLSGSLDDGTAGAIAVRERGGLVLAQDPEKAAYPGMPQSAITHVNITEIATAEQLGVVVSRLCRTPSTPTDEVVPDHVASNAELADQYDTATVPDERSGQ
jgi:two-component system chemotaxis response regulator CheB